MGMTKRLAMLCVATAASATTAIPATADDRAPSSLHMRDRRPGSPRPAPIPLGRRVAQAPTDPSPDAAPTEPPPGEAPAAPAPAPPAGPTAPAPAVSPSAEDDGKTEVISVTDSVEHELFTGRAPVSVVTRADLVASGRGTLGDILQALPAQSNAGNAQVNAGGDGATRINLRGLGAPRTLVLLNGRRIVNGGAGADAAVDVNAIPLAMIERVEILKDGASALYGADAIGGVVNLISRPQFDGTDVSLLTSTSQHGDGTEYEASAVTGFRTSDKRTYLVVSGGYQRHEPVFAGDREFSRFQSSYDFARKIETRNASLATPDGRLDASSIGPGGMQPPGCSSSACRPDGSGGWADFVAPRDLYNDAAENYLYTPSTRYNLFATAGNRINQDAAMFLELMYQHRDSSRQLPPVAFAADSPISKDSIYNPLGGDLLDYRRRLTELGPRRYIDQVSTKRLVAGITGEVPESAGFLAHWKYELSGNYGITEARAGTTGQLLRARVADALGPSMYVNDTPICVRRPGDASSQIIYIVRREGLPPLAIPCVPLDLHAPAGAIPSHQLENLTFSDAGWGTDNLLSAVATAGGRLAELPSHGAISLSLGGEYRSEVGDQAPPDVASVGFGYTSDNGAKATEGRFHSYDGFGELSIIPVTGHDLARHVEIDLGARVQRHSKFGSALTYKAGGLFRTVGGIAVRGTYATAFRAPTVPDLFRGRTELTPAAEDPCDAHPPSAGDGTRALDPAVQARCSAQDVPVDSKFNTSQQVAVIGGNPDLRAERAGTATIGIVVEPPPLIGLALSADYWHVDIDNAIETLGIHTIFANCYDRGIQSYCDQIERDRMTHRIFAVKQLLQNVPRTTTSGIDLALRYDTRFIGLGRIHAGLEAQYLLSYDLDTSVDVIHGAGYYDLGVYPRLKANLSGAWSHPGGASAGFSLRFVGTYKECAGDNCNDARNLATASRDVDRYVKLDLYGSYDLRSGFGRTTVQIGVNNALDATPPVVYNATAANSDATTYDFIGRMIYLRLAQQF
jgi:outer membrane receptor protein involved in Fe transport